MTMEVRLTIRSTADSVDDRFRELVRENGYAITAGAPPTAFGDVVVLSAGPTMTGETVYEFNGPIGALDDWEFVCFELAETLIDEFGGRMEDSEGALFEV